MKQLNCLTLEHALYALALLAALFVRLVQLETPPLSDFEAGWALQALAVARGGPVTLGPNPGYVILTGLLFGLFGSGNLLARLIPAVAGSLVVLAPLFFRRWVGRPAALAAAFGLALDPGLVASARLAGGPSMALGFGLLALGAAACRRPVLAGGLAGLAFLSGVPFWQGLLGLAAGLGLGLLLVKPGERSAWPALERWEGPLRADRASTRLGVSMFAGVVLFFGSGFFMVPQALSALAAAFPAYLQGWLAGNQVLALRLLFGLLVYEPLPLLFGLAGAVLAWRPSRPGEAHRPGRALRRALSLWFLAALVLALLYPSRQMADLVWTLIPLWGLAALVLADLFSKDHPYRLIALAQAAVVLALLAFAWINLSALTQPGQTLAENLVTMYAALFAAAGVLVILTTALVGLGWSWPAAWEGLALGLLLAFGLYGLATGRGIEYDPARTARGVWGIGPAAGQADLMLETLTDLSTWHTGQKRSLNLAVLVDRPSLRWALRDWKEARFMEGLVPGDQPEVILTLTGQQPSFAASYQGQDFEWSVSPAWEGPLPQELARWVVFRSAPRRSEMIVLWARADVFPGGETAGLDTPLPTDFDEEDPELDRIPVE